MPKLIPILCYPNPRLYNKAQRVTDVHAPEVQTTLDDMLYTLEQTEHCAGLAATQLDFAKPLAITVLNDYSADGLQPRYLINPEIIATEGEQFEEEGCMSVFPSHVHSQVKRAAKVTIRALDREGNTIEYTAEGYAGKLLQHEIDHLNGVIYLQRLSALRRSIVTQKLQKLIKRGNP